SFAPTTSAFRYLRLLSDERIPGTLNIGYVVPTIAQAAVYIRIIPVEPATLILLIAAAALGAWVGAAFVVQLPRERIQLGMGLALLGGAIIMVLSQPQVGLLPPGGNALRLEGLTLLGGVAGNFVLGALMTIGIGLYAPC